MTAPPSPSTCSPTYYNYNAIWRAVLQQFAPLIAHASLIALALALALAFQWPSLLYRLATSTVDG